MIIAQDTLPAEKGKIRGEDSVFLMHPFLLVPVWKSTTSGRTPRSFLLTSPPWSKNWSAKHVFNSNVWKIIWYEPTTLKKHQHTKYIEVYGFPMFSMFCSPNRSKHDDVFTATKVVMFRRSSRVDPIHFFPSGHGSHLGVSHHHFQNLPVPSGYFT